MQKKSWQTRTARLAAGTLAAALALGAFTGCGEKKGEGDKALTKVTVNEVTHSVFYAPQYAAINLGFFEEEGIDIDLSVGQGTDKVMTGVLSGSIDVGFGGPEAAIYIYNEGKENYSQIFAQLTKRDGSFLVGREKDDNFSWSKLKGTTLLPGRKGGVPYMTLGHVLRQNGLIPGTDLTLDDSIQFSAMAGAFTGGNGDYVALFEPTASMLEKEGRGYIVASIGEESGEIPYTAYFASKDFIEKNPELVQRFTNAVYKGQQWVQSHSAKEVAEAIAPSFADTDVELLTTVVQHYKDIDAWSTDPVMERESFERLQDVMTEAGELKQKADYDNLVNNTFAEAAKANG